MTNEMIALEQNIFDAETSSAIKTSNKRSDTHRPSAINPSEYQFVAFEYIPQADSIGACMFLIQQREIIRAHMARTGGNYSGHQHGGNCMVCGNALALYTVLFYHQLTNSYVRMGSDCAQKCQMAYTTGKFDAFKRAVNAAREAMTGKRKAQAILIEAGNGRAWDIYMSDDRQNYKYEEFTINDMVGNLVRYGNISPKAMNYIGVLLNKIDQRVVIGAQRAAEKAAAANVPNPGTRFVVEGTVVSKKYKDDIEFPAYKLVVKHASGWCVYGTQPASLSDVKVGDLVKFSATVTVKDDPKFGFFSRPTNGVVVTLVDADEVLEVAGHAL